jgi:hypothetical protein
MNDDADDLDFDDDNHYLRWSADLARCERDALASAAVDDAGYADDPPPRSGRGMRAARRAARRQRRG